VVAPLRRRHAEHGRAALVSDKQIAAIVTQRLAEWLAGNGYLAHQPRQQSPVREDSDRLLHRDKRPLPVPTRHDVKGMTRQRHHRGMRPR
jgi:hypothetical protein